MPTACMETAANTTHHGTVVNIKNSCGYYISMLSETALMAVFGTFSMLILYLSLEN